jgi:soluble lytic murein transglycosylase
MTSGNFSTVTASILACSLLFASCAEKRDVSKTPQAVLKEHAPGRDGAKKPPDATTPSSIHARAVKAQKEGKFTVAREDFLQLADSGYILEDYAALGLAQTGISAGNIEGVLPILDGVLERHPESPLREQMDGARLKIACVDETARICADYMENIRKGRVSLSFEPELLCVSAKRREKAGEILEAYKEYQKIYFGHPGSRVEGAADESMRAIEKANEEAGAKIKLPVAGFELKMERIDKLESARKFSLTAAELSSLLKTAPKHETARMLYKLGIALKKTRDREGAKQAFEKLLDKGGGGPYGGMGAYNLALIEWNEDMDKQAENRLLKALKGAHGKEVKKLCYLLLGRIYEGQGNLKSARVQYMKSLELASAGAESADLDWRVCWTEYRMGNMKDAGRRFLDAHKRTAEGERDGAFLYWAVRAFEKAGLKKDADKARGRLADGFAETYYGAMVKDGSYSPRAVTATFTPPVDALPGKPILDARATRLLDRYNALNDLGNAEGAKLEAVGLSGLIGEDNGALMWLATLYREAGDMPSSIKTASRATGKLPNGSKKDYTRPEWRALYPAGYWEAASRESAINGLDPFLTLSLIRQESMFDHRAVSTADARGLMQLLPSTAKMASDALSKGAKASGRFDEDSLFEPETNIRLGAAHFASLAGKYGGNMVRSIAAYNAGSVAVDKWTGRFGEVDDDEFVERISYSETRVYVKKVLRNAALYRRIYGDGGPDGVKISAVRENAPARVSGPLSRATKAGEGWGEGK